MAHQSEEELVDRLLAHDPTMWPEGSDAHRRLGWLEVPRETEHARRELTRWAASIDEATVVVLGTGPAAAGVRALAGTAAAFSAPRGRHLVVCDTTEPETIAALPLEESFILVTSSQGAGGRSQALFDYARTRNSDLRRYAVLSDDPASALARQASELRVQRIFEVRPDLGGSCLALSEFGVVPAVLAGYELEELCGRALDVDKHAAASIGRRLAEAVLEGRDEVTLRPDANSTSAVELVGQLFANATGKAGRGIIPVPPGPRPSADREELPLALGTAHELGALVYEMEIASAVAAHLLGVDPSDLSDLKASRSQAAALLEELPLPPRQAVDAEALRPFLAEELREGDYLSLEAYLPQIESGALEALRLRLAEQYPGHAVTAGLAPALLDSTGQLHHGGPESVLVIQLLPRAPRTELPVPGASYDFGTLTDAQAIGDRLSLEGGGRRVLVLEVDELDEVG